MWDDLHPTPAQQRELDDWLTKAGENVLTGDSFFHLAGFGAKLPGLNMCGAGRVVCLIDPIGDVYACPFAIHETFRAGNIVADGGFARVWRDAESFAPSQQLGRLIQPAEVAKVIAFCCSRAGEIMTGSVISAEGGFRG